jgi:hypothetical protein
VPLALAASYFRNFTSLWMDASGHAKQCEEKGEDGASSASSAASLSWYVTTLLHLPDAYYLHTDTADADHPHSYHDHLGKQ